MAPNATARKNHDALFPGHVSTLARTDPEFIDYFDNFAFDEVLRHGDLEAGTRLMVQLAARIIESVEVTPAPLRMVLGSLALASTLATLRKRIADFKTQTELAASTDYPAGE